MKVTKEVTFDSAHMLSNYSGKCQNLHGHTYKLQVTVEGPIAAEGNEECMVVDFNNLKRVINSITEYFDHAIIFSDTVYRGEAENALLEWAETYGMNYIILPDAKSTSEYIASYIAACIESAYPTKKISVKVWETPTSFTEV